MAISVASMAAMAVCPMMKPVSTGQTRRPTRSTIASRVSKRATIHRHIEAPSLTKKKATRRLSTTAVISPTTVGRICSAPWNSRSTMLPTASDVASFQRLHCLG